MEKEKKLKRTYLSITKGAIYTLLILFVFGMIVNLYVEIPDGLINQAAWSFVFSSAPVLAIHTILGSSLFLVAIASIILALLNHNSKWIIGSVLGLVFTALAAFSGADFVTNGGSNLSSLLMAFGFLGVLISYTLAIISK